MKAFKRLRKKPPEFINVSDDEPPAAAAGGSQSHGLPDEGDLWEAPKDAWGGAGDDSRYNIPVGRYLWESEAGQAGSRPEGQSNGALRSSGQDKKKRKRARRKERARKRRGKHKRYFSVSCSSAESDMPSSGSAGRERGGLAAPQPSGSVVLAVDSEPSDADVESEARRRDPPGNSIQPSSAVDTLDRRRPDADAGKQPRKSRYFGRDGDGGNGGSRLAADALRELSRKCKRKGRAPSRMDVDRAERLSSGSPPRSTAAGGPVEKLPEAQLGSAGKAADGGDTQQPAVADKRAAPSPPLPDWFNIQKTASMKSPANPSASGHAASALNPAGGSTAGSPASGRKARLRSSSNPDHLAALAAMSEAELLRHVPRLGRSRDALASLSGEARVAAIRSALEDEVHEAASYVDAIEAQVVGANAGKRQGPEPENVEEGPAQCTPKRRQPASAEPQPCSPVDLATPPPARGARDLGDDASHDGNMRVALWEPPASPFLLIEEALFNDPWRLLVACMLLNRTTGRAVRKILWKLFQVAPTPEAAAEVDTAKVEEVIRPLGLFRKRAIMFRRFSREYIEKDWRDPQQLHGIGQYAADAYYIFCRNRWRDRPPPQDKDLRQYYDWLVDTRGLGTACEREVFTAPTSSADTGGACGGTGGVDEAATTVD